jgi:hypothetical protein
LEEDADRVILRRLPRELSTGKLAGSETAAACCGQA